MTDIEQKALALINEILKERRIGGDCDTIYRATDATDEALCRAFEQHEAFRQEVSDAVVEYTRGAHPQNLGQFIIPAPKPDPLVDVAKMMGYFNTTANHWAGDVRAALDARGFEIREKGQ